MRVERNHISGDRYQFDFILCTSKLGWVQIDTSQDASYFGNWFNPVSRTFVSFTEGDLTMTACENDMQLIAELLRIMQFYDTDEQPVMLDPGFNLDVIRLLVQLGLTDRMDAATLRQIAPSA